MSRHKLLIFFVVCWTAPWLVSAADLSSIDRQIARQPDYEVDPRYCLLVFGDDASTRVWLALAGDTLYVDRNGNSDLTDSGESVSADHSSSAPRFIVTLPGPDGQPSGRLDLSFDKDQAFIVWFSQDKRVQMVRSDASGPLQFAHDAAGAPIVHLNGPLSFGLLSAKKLQPGTDVTLSIGMGTPGLGPGTFAAIKYYEVPEDVYPSATIRIPSRAAETPVITQVAFQERF